MTLHKLVQKKGIGVTLLKIESGVKPPHCKSIPLILVVTNSFLGTFFIQRQDERLTG
ncbi:MAG TPA: hypothetical protein PLL06_02505 [Acidobacteriota bacterium]|nr:hypothetical protein [Acidobacteriota bacterium]HND19719.1 hypothetical protein [Acidobacteriota bacterium]